MSTESFRLSVVLPASPEEIYRAWLDGKQHTAFTGGAANNDGRVGGSHSAWDGYITGTNLALVPSQRIVQSWRTTEFPDDAPDSRLELIFSEVQGGTELVLEHTEIPEDQAGDYEQGWVDHYFEPMKRHFENLKRAPNPRAGTRSSAKPAANKKSKSVRKAKVSPRSKAQKPQAPTSKAKQAAKKKAVKAKGRGR
jgi:uncharacterized protein YndB with AHSA1/START domain